jgi:hypothetical protein
VEAHTVQGLVEVCMSVRLSSSFSDLCVVQAIGMVLMQLIPTQNSAVQEVQESLSGSL